MSRMTPATVSMNMFIENRPPKWEEFCSYLFREKTTSCLRSDVVFQILHYILTDGKEPTLFHVEVAQAMHSLTRSKEQVTALNQHGICISYNTIKRIDVDLAERIIATAGNNRVPIPAVLESSTPLNGAMDNFDRNENTLAGTGSTHDTILVLFQNVARNLEKPSGENELSILSNKSRTTVKLRSKVGCQELIRMGIVKECGESLVTPAVVDLEQSTTGAGSSTSAIVRSTHHDCNVHIELHYYRCCKSLTYSNNWQLFLSNQVCQCKESYGYVRRNNSVVPEFVISKPDNLPNPCTCGKCAHKNGC